MKHFILLFLIILSCIVPTIYLSAQDSQVYKHPSLNLAVEAPSNWKLVKHPKDPSIYEIADPKGAVHVMLWYTCTMQDAKGYLEKMGDMKGLIWEEEPVNMNSWKDDAWMIDATGDVWGMKARTLLTVIHRGYDSKYTDHYALYIVMIWCPKEKFPQYQDQMKDILKSVRFTEHKN